MAGVTMLRHTPHRATIERPQESDATGVDAYAETVGEYVPVDEGVPCVFDDESTSFVREDTGERVQRPATVGFNPGVDIEEGDRLTVDGVTVPSVAYEVQDITIVRDDFRGGVDHLIAGVERAD